MFYFHVLLSCTVIMYYHHLLFSRIVLMYCVHVLISYTVFMAYFSYYFLFHACKYQEVDTGNYKGPEGVVVTLSGPP